MYYGIYQGFQASLTRLHSTFPLCSGTTFIEVALKEEMQNVNYFF